MTKKFDLRKHAQNEIQKINNLSMVETIQKISNVKATQKGTFDCPICGHNSCSISNNGKYINCWSNRCFEGSDVFNMLQKFYKAQGITDFKEVYKAIDGVTGSSLFVGKQEIAKKNAPQKLFTNELKIEKYCSEKTGDILDILKANGKIIVDAKTGTGKTRLISDLGKLMNEVDFVFLLTARRSIVEEIAETYKYTSFVGNQTKFDLDWKPKYDDNGNCIEVVSESNLIVATTHKARAINDEIFRLSCERKKEISYVVIIDECHLLHSSRNIIGNINQLERLIDNANYSLFTSANTNHFYNASKEQYGIKSYVSIERNHKIDNLEQLDIVRLTCNGTAKLRFMEGTIINQLQDNKKVFYINNNKAFNEELCEIIKSYGIHCVHINAENKEIEEYDAIIKDSTLQAPVTICTSVIDTGVNIKAENITTIISCNSNTFDDISIIQGFARVRTSQGNKGILVLEEGGKERENSIQRNKDIEYYIEEYTSLADTLCELFNIHMLDNYDFTSYDEYCAVWELLKDNELYKGFKDCLKVICDKGFSNPRMITDKVMIYEKSRKHQLRESYFNDKFIGNALKDIMTSKITWNETTVIGEKIEKIKNEGNQEDFKNEIEFILNDKRSLEQLEKHYLYNTKINDTEVFIDLMEIDKDRTISVDKEVKKITRLCTKTKEGKEKFNYKHIIKKSYEIQMIDEIKERNRETIKMIYSIYNELYENIEYNCDNGLGDLAYISVRETFDKVIKSRNKFTKRHLELCAMEYVNKHLSIKGKEISKRTALSRVKKAFELSYELSEKGYIKLNRI